MPPRREWTDAEDQILRDLAAAGKPISAMVAALDDRHKSSVKRRLDRLGIHGDRSQTMAATQAKVIDAKARRAALEVKLLEDAEKLREQIWAPTLVYNFGGKDNTYEERHLDEPPHADKLKLMQAIGVAVDRSLKISDHDADTGVTEAVGALDQIAEALAEVAKTLPDMGPDQ
jgi:hypothetical protein